jgi:hypothetical protein
MAKNGNVHVNSLYTVLLAPLTIAAAVAATGTTPVTVLGGAKYLVAEAKFLYGAGGTTAKAYVQTSLDGGVTWMDIICFAFTTSALSKVSAVSADVAFAASAYVPIAPTDGSLTDNTSIQGIFGDRFRLKYVTTGIYSGATSLAVYAHIKG